MLASEYNEDLGVRLAFVAHLCATAIGDQQILTLWNGTSVFDAYNNEKKIENEVSTADLKKSKQQLGSFTGSEHVQRHHSHGA